MRNPSPVHWTTSTVSIALQHGLSAVSYTHREATTFNTPKCAVYQNVDAQAHTDAEEIKANLIAQLTASVRWTQEVQNMIAAGATDFTECGPGKVLQGMIGKIAKGNDAVTAHGIQA